MLLINIAAKAKTMSKSKANALPLTTYTMRRDLCGSAAGELNQCFGATTLSMSLISGMQW